MSAWKHIQLSVAGRIAVSLVLLSTFTLMVANLLGIVPNARHFQNRHRAGLCEALSISCSLMAQRNDHRGIKDNLWGVMQRNPDMRSACVRRADGLIIEQCGEHEQHWRLTEGAPSTRDNVHVPIYGHGKEWGTVEVCFAKPHGLLGTMGQHPMLCLAIVTVCLNGVLFRWYMGRVLTYLDPSKSVPTHVRSTLDTFAEGVVVLDDQRRIVLANQAFTAQVGKSITELQGKGVDKLAWQYDDGADSPWQLDNPHSGPTGPRTGVKLGLRVHENSERTFLVNTSAILAKDGRQRGTIASFDDITLMERKKEELSRMLIELKQSRNELTQRNQELQYLATRDPLTGCVNRRSFFETFEKLWNAASRYQKPLSCYMVDIDHFKSINDNHGHGVGDQVLREVANTIRQTARDADVVCRYGGEEFCVLLPQTEIDQAERASERIRQAIEQLAFDNLCVTVSLGVSAIGFGSNDPQELLDQADQSLYVAKRGGRNQVMRWDEVPGDIDQKDSTRTEAVSDVTGKEMSIPYPAVTSLLSALAYRDPDTAAHSTRVAELCVATARGLMSQKEVYILEIAALLHDIGKIGVPDVILLKPGPLTRQEWETMERHDRIGVEIVEASFSNPRLVDIVRYHHATYGGSPNAPEMPRGELIPLGARIVTIADAYDAMVSDRVYRKGRSKGAAFQELRRCAGRQFDPDLVERFVKVAEDFGSTQLTVGSKQSALQIGLQIERLAQAVDDRDKNAINALAARLESTACHCRIPEIERVAAQIKEAADDDSELVTLIEMVTDLIDLCSSTQKVYADVPRIAPLALRTARQPDLPRCRVRPGVQMSEDGSILLTQDMNEDRENRIQLTWTQREQAGKFILEQQRSITPIIERRLPGKEQPDVLIRISSDDQVNLTQLVGPDRRAHVIFDTVEGISEWAIMDDMRSENGAFEQRRP